jgi:hypothetical protein
MVISVRHARLYAGHPRLSFFNKSLFDNLSSLNKTWMAGTSPAMTLMGCRLTP